MATSVNLSPVNLSPALESRRRFKVLFRFVVPIYALLLTDEHSPFSTA